MPGHYLFKPVALWSPQIVSKWITGLHPLAKQHSAILLTNNITGSNLISLSWSDLDSMRIVGMYDQEALLSAVSVLRDVDENNKQYVIYPLVDRVLNTAREALDHITQLKLDKTDWSRKQELYMCCVNSGNLTRDILVYMDKYHIVLQNRCKLAHELLCSLYSISYAALQLKHSLRGAGIHVPDVPQELPYNMRNTNISTCLQASLKSLVDNAKYIKDNTDLKNRGCPSFERITLHPEGDTGWGFSFRETSSGIYIVKRILANTPADKSGRIKSGDEVIEVNDQNIVGWKIKNVVDLIRSQPTGLVMVVRHYPDNSQLAASPNQPATSPNQPATTPRSSMRSTRSSPPASSNCVVDTPKKPPRPLDSVLRERCKSNNELDKHFKTVHNPKRLSQIYGDNDLLCGPESMGMYSELEELENGKYPINRHAYSRNTPPVSRKRVNNNVPAYHRRSGSNPLDKYNIVTNQDWLKNISVRGEKSKSIKYGTAPHIRGKRVGCLNVSMPDIAVDYPSNVDMGSSPDHMTTEHIYEHVIDQSVMDVVNNLNFDDNKIAAKDKLSDLDTDSVITTQSTISNCASIDSRSDNVRSKTLPRKKKTSITSDCGEFKNYPVHKESNYSACVIGGVVHKIPLPNQNSSEEENTVACYNKSRKRQNKRSSWSIASEKAATLPKNLGTLHCRFSMGDLDENGTLKKKKNKKPSRSTSTIIGDVNVSCQALYPNACEGWLLKLGGSGLTPKNWRRRWFVLKGFCLYYFKTPQDNVALGVITLPSFNIATAHEIKKKYAFKAYHKNTRTFYFIAESEELKQRWIDKMLLASILYDESDKESGYGTGASPVATDTCSLNHTIEQVMMSPCQSLQSLGSTTVV